MSRSVILFASLLVVASAAGASAGPSGPAPYALAATPVAMGCGAGRTRDAAGHCHRHFDMFRHHEQFQAYKKRHCEKIQTPNGRVNRCQI